MSNVLGDQPRTWRWSTAIEYITTYIPPNSRRMQQHVCKFHSLNWKELQHVHVPASYSCPTIPSRPDVGIALSNTGELEFQLCKYQIERSQETERPCIILCQAERNVALLKIEYRLTLSWINGFRVSMPSCTKGVITAPCAIPFRSPLRSSYEVVEALLWFGVDGITGRSHEFRTDRPKIFSEGFLWCMLPGIDGPSLY